MGVDLRNHLYAPGLTPRWIADRPQRGYRAFLSARALQEKDAEERAGQRRRQDLSDTMYLLISFVNSPTKGNSPTKPSTRDFKG